MKALRSLLLIYGICCVVMLVAGVGIWFAFSVTDAITHVYQLLGE